MGAMRGSKYLALLMVATAAAAAGPPSAEMLLGDAKTKAEAEHKAIFLDFGASW